MGTRNISLLACGATRLIVDAIRSHEGRFAGEKPRCVSLSTSAWTEFLADVGSSGFMPAFKPESMSSCVFHGVRIEHSRRLQYSVVLNARMEWEDL